MANIKDNAKPIDKPNKIIINDEFVCFFLLFATGILHIFRRANSKQIKTILDS